MKSALLLAAVVSLPFVGPATRQFRYERALTIVPGPMRQACVVLDASVFAHAASESLNDLRIYSQPSFIEIPFNLSISDTQSDEDEAANVLHSGVIAGDIAFDLKMPSRPYSALVLVLAAQNFIATATVTGSSSSGAASTALGTFALFDLTSQHLSRSTTLSLQESNFPILHIKLQIKPAPGSASRIFSPSIVQGAIVPPSREAQTLYTPVTSTTVFTQQGTDTVATIHVPAHVPAQQMRILLSPRFGTNFLRRVEITATPDNTHDAAATEVFSGEISHVELPQINGLMPVDNLQSVIDMPLGANLRSSATVRIRIHNGDAPPLPLAVAVLEMRQRKLCFDAASSEWPYLLLYGDPMLHAPVYDYARSFTPALHPVIAILGPEKRNPHFTPNNSAHPLTERYPDLPWVIALAIIAIFGSMALRSSRSKRG